MKILMYPHSLEIGGTQIQVIEVARAMQDRGHQVVILAPHGPLVELARKREVRVIQQPAIKGHRPSLRASWWLWKVARKQQVDIVHSHSHSASLEAFMGAFALQGLPLVGSTMGRILPDPFPTAVPLIVGKRLLQDRAQQMGNRLVHLVRPAIDTDADHPSIDGSAFLEEHGLDSQHRNVVLVSRLVSRLKLEGVERAMAAVEILAQDMAVRLILVGGGEGYEGLLRSAEAANSRLGKRSIVLIGPMLDPRPAYAAADVVLGQGSSVLRGMAFEKPAVVLGERGFSKLISPTTIDYFLTYGMWGLGDGDLSPNHLCEELRPLLLDAPLRHRLGRFSRQFVCENFSLTSAAASLERIYRSAAATRPSPSDRLRGGVRFAGTVVLRRVKKSATRLTRSSRDGATRKSGL